MRERILVVGAGIAGITVSIGLAQAGHEVFIVELEKEIGGKGKLYTCKATDYCQHCSACLITKAKIKLKQYSNIHILPYSMLTGIHGNPPYLRASIRLLNEIRSDLGAETSLEVQAVVVATGFDVHQPVIQVEMGYNTHKQVILASELERILAEPQQFINKFGRLRHFGVVLCVGSQDERIHPGQYCSRFCCSYAQHLTRRLSHLFPNVKIDVFYTDLFKVHRKEFESNQVRLIRGTPAKVFAYPGKNLTVRFADSFTGFIAEDEYDLLILIPAQEPHMDLGRQFPQLGLKYDKNGFYEDNNFDIEHNSGVFVAGTCTGPKNIPESVAHAKATIAHVLRYLAQIH